MRNWMPPVAMISWTSGRWQESLFATAHRHEFRPYQHQRINDISQGRPLLDEKDARTLAIRFKEVAEVARHRPEIGSDKNPILTRGEGQHLGVGNSFQCGLMGREKIDCRLTAETPGDDRIRGDWHPPGSGSSVNLAEKRFAAAYVQTSS